MKINILIWILLLFCKVSRILTVEKNSIIMRNVFLNEEDDELNDINYSDSLYKPWKFAEEVPEFEMNEENENDLMWSMSAGELVRMTNPRIYNRLQAPGQIQGTVTNVAVGVYVESMSTFRVRSMDYILDMYLMLGWYDFRLKHNFTHPILCTDYQIISNRMWHPDLYFVNSKFSYIHRMMSPNFMLLIYPDGFLTYTMRVEATLACILDLRYFPFDKQNCSAVIQSYAFVESLVNLSWHHDGKQYPIFFNPKIVLSDMNRLDPFSKHCDQTYPMFRGKGMWSCLEVVIMMKRRLDFHIFQIFIPAGMLVIISWLSFWLDIKSSPARISLTITTLLTLTTISNGSRQELPHVPYMKANDVWFAVCQGFVFSVLLEYTLVNFIFGRQTVSKCVLKKETVLSVPPITQAESESSQNLKSVITRDWEACAKRVDNVSKLLFPTCFIIFVLIYVSIYHSN